MSIDYIVSSLPSIAFGAPAPMTWEKFASIAPVIDYSAWKSLETELNNAQAIARGGEKYVRPADGCSLYWKNRVLACFQEKDVMKREEMLDRVRWDAAGELTPPADPLGKGALLTYAIRLRIALRRSAIDMAKGNEVFDRMTEATKGQAQGGDALSTAI